MCRLRASAPNEYRAGCGPPRRRRSVRRPGRRRRDLRLPAGLLAGPSHRPAATAGRRAAPTACRSGRRGRACTTAYTLAYRTTLRTLSLTGTDTRRSSVRGAQDTLPVRPLRPDAQLSDREAHDRRERDVPGWNARPPGDHGRRCAPGDMEVREPDLLSLPRVPVEGGNLGAILIAEEVPIAGDGQGPRAALAQRPGGTDMAKHRQTKPVRTRQGNRRLRCRDKDGVVSRPALDHDRSRHAGNHSLCVRDESVERRLLSSIAHDHPSCPNRRHPSAPAHRQYRPTRRLPSAAETPWR